MTTQESDRELLELAAKAAGLCGIAREDGIELTGDAPPPYDWKLWNPLTDDGDALWLAVKLGLLIDVDENSTDAGSFGAHGYHTELHDADPYAATRRAIVRAAAALRQNPGRGVTEAGYVFVCSNPACRAVHIRDPRGFCPACVAENGGGWSTTRQKLYRNGQDRYSTEEEGDAYMDGWYDGQAALSAQATQGVSEARFRIVDGSQSCHYCFEFTVVDATKPVVIGGEQYVDANGPQFEAVCECFEREEADLICDALNKVHPGFDVRKYVRHMADVLEAGGDLFKVDADLLRLAAAINKAANTAPPAQPERVPEVLVEQMDMLLDDFRKYEKGDPKVPFVVVRDALVAALNEWADWREAASPAPSEGGKGVEEGDAIYADIGRAFRSVLADPAVAWRETGAKLFIDRVCSATAAQQAAR